MSQTWITIRRAVGRDLNECVTGVVDSATTTTMTDADLIDSIENESRYVGAWIVTGTDYYPLTVRRISAYDPATGTLTLSRAWAAAPSVSTEYEIHTLINPLDLKQIINDVLEQCSFVERLTITPAEAEETAWDLSPDGDYGHVGLISASQIRDVRLYSYSDERERRVPISWWWVDPDDMRLYVRGYLGSTGEGDEFETDLLYVYFNCAYTRLSDTPTTPTLYNTTECPLRWLRPGIRSAVYRYLVRNGPAQDSKRYEEAGDREAVRFATLTMQYAPRPVLRVQTSERPWRGQAF